MLRISALALKFRGEDQKKVLGFVLAFNRVLYPVTRFYSRLEAQAEPPRGGGGGGRGDNDHGAHQDYTEKWTAIAAVQATCRYYLITLEQRPNSNRVFCKQIGLLLWGGRTNYMRIGPWWQAKDGPPLTLRVLRIGPRWLHRFCIWAPDDTMGSANGPPLTRSGPRTGPHCLFYFWAYRAWIWENLRICLANNIQSFFCS